jgi:short subunit dehydrogenase-like uncharacterized protein
MPIAIYGATGFSGRLIAETLAARGHDLVVVGRDPERVRALGEALGVPWRAASVGDPDALVAAFHGASVVLSCAGPFAELGEPVLRAALEAGAGFADISGEQAYARHLYERYESRARRERRVIATGLAFEPAAGDWAASLAARALGPGRLDEVVVAYALSRIPLTPGLVASLRSTLAAPAAVWAHDRWEAASAGAAQELIGFPAPFGERLAVPAPFSASITIPRHIDTEAARTLVAAGRPTPARKLALKLAAAAAPALARSPLAAEVSALVPAQPTEEELSGAQVAVVAIARRGFQQARVALVGPNVYQLTAEIVALTVPRLASHEGALAPSEVVEPGEALDALRARAGIHIERAS